MMMPNMKSFCDGMRPAGRQLGRALMLSLTMICGAHVLMPRADAAADERIQQRILTRLAGQVTLHLEELQVDVKDGVAHLSGSTGSIGETQSVERIVRSIVGVATVVSDLTVRPRGSSESMITQEVRRLLDRRTRFKTSPIEVDVAGTEVTLSGKVQRGIDRLDAETIAAGITGVTRVVNNLEIASAGTSTAEEIRKKTLAILTNPLTFGLVRKLAIEVSGGTVTLTGVVSRDQDRLEAERLTLAVPGVTSVDNRIEVEGS
ncbi:MAG TPA: BON domain-containing protein [Candidatus Polarisedimenticolia bacterium]|nr:BON domain-containing protein [Candidatus Polarisedimenticolia bacterium]